MDLTTRSQQAVSAAVRAAAQAGNPAFDPAHLLVALLDDTEGLARPLLQAVGADPTAVAAAANALVARLPAASGSTVGAPQASRAMLTVLAQAESQARDMSDEYVSTEHLLLALAVADSDVKALLARYGATADSLRAALSTVRGSRRVTSRRPRVDVPGAGEVRRRPHRAGPRRRARPGDRA